MSNHLLFSEFYSHPQNAARVFIRNSPATQLPTLHTPQATSSTLASLHLFVSPHREQKKICTHTDLCLSRPYVLPQILLVVPLSSFLATHPLTTHIPRTTSNTSANSRLSVSFHPQQQNCRESYLFVCKAYVSPYIVPTTPLNNASGTHLVTVHTSQTT